MTYDSSLLLEKPDIIATIGWELFFDAI